jgi:hypothetical protein
MEKKLDNTPCCASCGKPWAKHLGPQSLCADNLRLRGIIQEFRDAQLEERLGSMRFLSGFRDTKAVEALLTEQWNIETAAILEGTPLPANGV